MYDFTNSYQWVWGVDLAFIWLINQLNWITGWRSLMTLQGKLPGQKDLVLALRQIRQQTQGSDWVHATPGKGWLLPHYDFGDGGVRSPWQVLLTLDSQIRCLWSIQAKHTANHRSRVATADVLDGELHTAGVFVQAEASRKLLWGWCHITTAAAGRDREYQQATDVPSHHFPCSGYAGIEPYRRTGQNGWV